MGTPLTTAQAAQRLSEIQGKVRTQHYIRSLVQSQRLKSKRIKSRLVIDDDDLNNIRPGRSGHKLIITPKEWNEIRAQVLTEGHSVKTVAAYYHLHPSTIYRYFYREGIRNPRRLAEAVVSE